MIKLFLACLLAVTVRAQSENGSHWIVMPETIVPGRPLPLTFNFYNTTQDVKVKADLIKDTHHLVSTANFTFNNAQPGIMYIQVPGDLPHQNRYHVIIHGLSGLYFEESARLRYDTGYRPETFAVLIQTDKAIYKPGQTVRFRTFGMFSNMTVYTGEFNISVTDPKGNQMKRMVNASEPNYGVVEDFMIMDSEPVLGKWSVSANSHSLGSTTKHFSVDKYVLPKFDVKVELPPYVLTSDKEMHGTVKATYTYGKPVIGKVLLQADLDYSYSPWKYHGDEVMVEITLDINGEAKFTVPFNRISEEVDPYSYTPLVQKLNGYHVTVKASVTESLNNLTRNASSSTQFYQQPYRVNFISSQSPTFFKPGLPYKAFVSITQADGRPVISTTKDVRLVTYIKFYDNTVHKYRAHSLPDVMYAPPPTGVLELDVDPPANAKSLHLEVHYQGYTATLNIDRPYWILDSSMQLTLNSSVAAIGGNAVFHLQSVDPVDNLFYMVIANNLVVHTGSMDGQSQTSVFISIPITTLMEPYGHLIVYYFTKEGDWNADSTYFSVNDGSAIFKNKVAIGFDKASVEPGDNITLQISTDPSSQVHLLAVDQSVLLMETGNDITQGDVVSKLKSASPPSQYSSYIHDPKQVMKTNGLQVLTDVVGFSWAQPYYKRQVDCIPISSSTMSPFWPTAQPGLVSGQTPTAQPGLVAGQIPTNQLQQVKRTRDFFPETWIWDSVVSGTDGSAAFTAEAPDTITSWVATAFSVNPSSGLGISDAPAKFKTFRPFFVSLNLPYSVIRGEEVVLQANVFNYMGQDMDVVVTLEQSNDFKVIQMDKSGNTNYVSQDVVKNIKIAAGKAESVFIPIVAAIVGTMDITVKAQTVLAADRVKRQLIVEAEGSPMHFNFPMILTASSTADVDLAFPDNVVADSQKIHVSAIGDLMGPVVKNLHKLLRLPTGCGEQTMSSFAPDVFVYNYLENTNQLTTEIKEKAITYMQKGYQRELGFQHYDGSFSIWGSSDRQGSMWLTAFVVKSFHQAKNHIYISQSVIDRAISWITNNQNYDGSFKRIGSVHDTMLKGGSSHGYGLTAFVLIALVENSDSHNYRVNQEAARARAYLEAHVQQMTSLYDLAITSYALAKSGSSLGAIAFRKLDNFATLKDGKKSWTASLRTTPAPARVPWYYVYHQSPPLDIEIASYALLYYITTNQLTAGMPVLKWLTAQRNSMGGFRSTQDTVLGLQAMSEYGAIMTGNLDMDIAVTSGNFTSGIHIGKSDAMVLKLIEVPGSSLGNNLGNGNKHKISLSSHGYGSALAQVSVTFNVETEVMDPAFNLTTSILQETLRSLVVESCARYNANKFTTGGMAVIEMGVPTGFVAELESDVTKLTGVQKTEIDGQKVMLYFDEIQYYKDTCVTIEMIRTDLVAKTKPASVKVYDYYDPDKRALAFYESQLLKDSSFCDICATCGCTMLIDDQPEEVFFTLRSQTGRSMMTTTITPCGVSNSTINYSCEENNSSYVTEYDDMQIKFACDLVNAAIIVLVMPFIVAGNLMVILAVIKFRKLRTSMNMFIASLAVSDLLVGFPTIPLYAIFYVKGEILRKFKYLCLFRYAFVIASMSGSIISLTFVSFDRYVAVIHPLHYQTLMTKRRVRFMLTGIWIYDIALSIMPLAGVNVWREGMPCQYFHIFPKPYTIFTVPFTLAVCLILSVSMYVAVFRVAQKHQERMKRLNVNSARKRIDNRRNVEKETRMAKVMAFILLLFVIFWFPFLATSLLKYLPFSKTPFEIAKTFGVTTAMINSVINPIIYCWLRKDFRQAFMKLACCKPVAKRRQKYTTKALKTNISWSLCSSDTSSIENFENFNKIRPF